MDCSAFHHFPDLPAELRLRIWRAALPETLSPSLHPYRTGCWRPRPDPEPYDEHHMILEFHFELLDHAEVDAPLARVSREARSVAVAWADRQGLGANSPARQGGRRCTFCRRFDREKSVLYVAADRYAEFVVEQNERAFQPDLFNRTMSVFSNIANLAIPRAVLREEGSTLCAIFDSFSIMLLCIVLDDLPDLQSGGSEERVQPCWQLQRAWSGSLFWDAQQRTFGPTAAEYVGDEALYKEMWTASEGMGYELRHYVAAFEIRPVIAVRTSC